MTDHVLDLRDRPTLRLEHRERVREIPLAVHLELRNLRHIRQQLLIGDAVPEIVGAGDERLGVHVFIEHMALQVGALGVGQLTIALTLVLSELLLIGLADVVARDLHAVHLGGVVGSAHGPVDAPKDEDEADRAEDHAGQPSLELVMYRLQHALRPMERG